MRTLFSLSLLVTTGMAHAATFTLDASGNGDFALFNQAVIDAMADGDVLNVEPGNYDFVGPRVNINKAVTIQGTAGASDATLPQIDLSAAATIRDLSLSCLGSDVVGDEAVAVNFGGSGALLEGVTHSCPNDPYTPRTLISVFYADITVRDARFDELTGSALYLGGEATVEDSTFSAFVASAPVIRLVEPGAGIGGPLTVTNSSFSNLETSTLDAPAIHSDRIGSVVLVVEDSTFSNNIGTDAGAIAVLGASDVQLRNNLLTNNAGGAAGAVFVQGSGVFTSEANRYTNNTGHRGAAVRVEGPDMDSLDDLFDANETGGGEGGEGGAIVVESPNGSVTLTNATVTNNLAATYGGGLYSLAGLTTLEGVTMSGNTASMDGGAVYMQVDGSQDNRDLVIRNSRLEANLATDSGGGVMTLTGGDVIIETSTFCGNQASTGADLNTAGPVLATSAVFALQAAGDSAHLSTGNHVYQNTTFVGVPGAAIQIDDGYLTVNETIFADVNPTALEGLGAASGTGSYNAFFQVTQRSGGVFAKTDPFFNYGIEIDPMFQSYTSGVTTCADLNAWLAPISPLRDQGVGTDLDGSASDLGAFGGPLSGLVDADGDNVLEDIDCNEDDSTIYWGAVDIPYDGIDQDCDGSDLTDYDGDGFDSTLAGGDDCDDNDFDINPGAPEIWYDGIDQDCAGDDDYDQDGDGHASSQHGGDDCNDTDPTINPEATEIVEDGIDQDCSGADLFDNSDGEETDKEEDASGCGCDNQGAPTSGFGVALLLALLARRRQH